METSTQVPMITAQQWAMAKALRHGLISRR